MFAVRNAIQFGTIPFAILLDGFLADNVFEPFMRSDSAIADFLKVIVGHGNGNGITGFLISIFSYRKCEIRELDMQ